jgi:tRNA U34 5-methylaminomethyl-2-thiouridine-forming methyltransferase MnmC
MSLSIKQTHDGSYTLFNEELNEHYHSIHGALQESLHVFIKKGLQHFNPNAKLAILEIGTGTGLNALLTIVNAAQRNIDYVGLEPFPIAEQMILQYIKNYPLPEQDKVIWLELMQNSAYAKEQIKVSIETITLQAFETEKTFDLLYFDAFAPNKQGELWEKEVFQKLYNLTNENGILVTYCAQGEFKRSLKAAGYQVIRTDGPPGKREMTIGIKTKD